MLIAKEVELKRLQDECEEQEREAVSRLLKLLDIHALLARENASPELREKVDKITGTDVLSLASGYGHA